MPTLIRTLVRRLFRTGACLSALFICTHASAEFSSQGPGSLLASAEVVAIVRIEAADDSSDITPVHVLKPIRGDIKKADSLNLRYPRPNIEDESAYVPPVKGAVLLAFLVKQEDGTYAPASSVVRTRHLSATGEAVSRVVYSESTGAASLNPLAQEDDPEITAGFVAGLSRWDQMKEPDRSTMIRSALHGSPLCRRLALRWVVLDGKGNFDAPGGICDDVAEGLIFALTSSDLEIKRTAILAIGMAVRKRPDLVPYLVEALDSPDTRAIAISRLDGARGKGPGPQLSSTNSATTNARLLKTWWDDVGAQKPEFRKFMLQKK